MVTSVVANKLLYVSFSLGAGLADDQFTQHIHVVITVLAPIMATHTYKDHCWKGMRNKCLLALNVL